MILQGFLFFSLEVRNPKNKHSIYMSSTSILNRFITSKASTFYLFKIKIYFQLFLALLVFFISYLYFASFTYLKSILWLKISNSSEKNLFTW